MMGASTGTVLSHIGVAVRALRPNEYKLIAKTHKANHATKEVCVAQANEFAAGDPMFDANAFLLDCGYPGRGGTRLPAPGVNVTAPEWGG